MSNEYADARLRPLLLERDKRIAELEAELEAALWELERRAGDIAARDENEELRTMLRLAILDGEHPAGMDADYLADLRSRAQKEKP